jgi:hypothetical protein
MCAKSKGATGGTRNAMDGQTAERQRKFLSRTRTKHGMVASTLVSVAIF